MYWPRWQPDRCKFFPVRKDGKRECPECTVSYRASKKLKPCVAHFDYARKRWCPGGERVTKQQKIARKKKDQSVYTVGDGGLPSLGKNR